MKKMYIICFLAFGVALSGIYIGSYQLTHKRLEAQEQTETAKLELEPEPELLGAVSADETIITRKTTYVLEEYSLNDDTLSSEILTPPVEILGYDRKKMTEYIQEYMENLSPEEAGKGLISLELTSFSKDKVVLRKTYYQDKKKAQFYLDVQMGRVVVYQTEDDTLYAYTELKFNNLPEALQREILAGKYIETIEELYHFLESYSS